MSNFGYKPAYLRASNLEVDTIDDPDTTPSIAITADEIVLGAAGKTGTFTAAAPVGTTPGAQLAITTANGTATAAPTDITISPGTASDGNDGADLQLTAGTVVGGGGDAGNVTLTGGIAIGGGSQGRVVINSPLDVKKSNTTQSSNIGTAVTVNNGAGQITTQAATAAANATNTFTVNNNRILSTDNVLLTIQSYGGSSIPTVRAGSIADGSFDIIIGNVGGATLDAALVIYFVIV